MGDLPGAIGFPKSDGQAQTRRVVLSQLFRRPASQEGRREGNPIPSRDMQFHNVECSSALRQGVEEWGPRLPIGCDPAYSDLLDLANGIAFLGLLSMSLARLPPWSDLLPSTSRNASQLRGADP